MPSRPPLRFPHAQGILAAGMGPLRDTGPRLMRSVVNRLRRRLRARGFRANYNLQLVRARGILCRLQICSFAKP